jgi:hypothetical protein
LSALALVVLVMPSVAGAQGYGYLYIQDNILIQSGANSFVGMHIGDDGLPYTADDLDLTANVETAGDNPGGVFSGFNYVTSGTPSAPSGFPTVGSINFYGDNLYRAHVRQAGLAHDGSFDDDGIGWARNGRFFRGRIAEADHWSDQNLVGVDLDAAGIHENVDWDFEYNDGNANWDDECNAGIYNNARANQHGQGNPRYYFSIDNTDALNAEHRATEWSAQHRSMTNVVTGSDNRYTVPTSHDRGGEALAAGTLAASWQRGFMIPIGDLGGLADGDLGDKAWHDSRFPGVPFPSDAGFDMAAYVRDTIGPLIADAGLELRQTDENKLTHLIIQRTSLPVDLTTNAAKQITADLYGAVIGDLLVNTNIAVADGGTDPALGDEVAMPFAPPSGVQYNAIAVETMSSLPGGPLVSYDCNGEVGICHNPVGENPWERLSLALPVAVCGDSVEGDIVQLNNGFDLLGDFDPVSGFMQLGGKGDCPPASNDKGPGTEGDDGVGSNGTFGLPACPDGPGTTPSAARVWDLENGPAYAEARFRVNGGTEDGQSAHLILERNDAPIAWAIIEHGEIPTLGIGGGVLRDCCNGAVTSAVEVPAHDGSPQQTFIDPAGSDAQLDDCFQTYVLCLDKKNSKVKLWMGEDAGAGLIATFCYDNSTIGGLDCFVDGMRLWGNADPTNSGLNELEIDTLAWGYDYCPCPELLYIWGQGANPNSNEFIFPQSAAASITCIPVTFNDAVTISGVCITSTGTPAATTATLGPDPARPGVGNYCLNLDAALEQQQWTTITFTATSGCGASGTICLQVAHLPADVNQDGNVGLADASAFVSEFNGAKRPCLVDSNNDGQVGLADVSDWVNNFNGNAGIGIPQGNGTFLPAKPACACP